MQEIIMSLIDYSPNLIFLLILSALISATIPSIIIKCLEKGRGSVSIIDNTKAKGKNNGGQDGDVEYSKIYPTRWQELYKKRQTDSNLKIISFILAITMSIIGTIILFIGIFFGRDNQWATVSSGVLTDIIASIYFWMVNRTMKEVKDNSQQLERAEDLMTAIDLTQKINDQSTRDEVYKSMVENLLSRNSASK